MVYLPYRTPIINQTLINLDLYGLSTNDLDNSITAEHQLILIGHNEFVSLAVDIDNLYLIIILEVLAQLRDINVH